MLCTPKILLITNNAEEVQSLAETLDNFAVLVHARNLEEMKSHLSEHTMDVIFCAWPFYSANWSRVREQVQQHQPNLPVIILSPDSAEQVWTEVLEAGAFDLLTCPCQISTAQAVVEQAVISHEARKAEKYMSENHAQPWTC